MSEEFWQARWRAGRTRFHQGVVNKHLERFFENLVPHKGHVFVPLCGKSLDLDWLLAQDVQVSGVEFHEPAVKEVFARLGLEPEITELRGLKRYRAGALTVFVGDLYALEAADLGPVDAVYDRAAMVAVVPDTRADYGAQITALSGGARQMIISYDYDQSKADGPPFSLPEASIRASYEAQYAFELLEECVGGGSIRDQVEANEQVWLLSPKA